MRTEFNEYDEAKHGLVVCLVASFISIGFQIPKWLDSTKEVDSLRILSRCVSTLSTGIAVNYFFYSTIGERLWHSVHDHEAYLQQFQKNLKKGQGAVGLDKETLQKQHTEKQLEKQNHQPEKQRQKLLPSKADSIKTKVHNVVGGMHHVLAKSFKNQDESEMQLDGTTVVRISDKI